MRALLLCLAVGAGAIELSSDNWDAETQGKSVFIKFLAPWCGHCKSLKPDWDKLMEDFAGSPTSLVADVDCTAEGKSLCETHGVSGYPTIKYGDPASLQDFEGERTYEALKEFADENLGPSCSPGSMDLCDDEKKAVIEKFQKMSTGKLEAKIRKAEATMTKLDADFEALQKTLQARYTEAEEKKKAKVAEIKESGLGLMKAVSAHRSQNGEKAKDEL